MTINTQSGFMKLGFILVIVPVLVVLLLMGSAINELVKDYIGETKPPVTYYVDAEDFSKAVGQLRLQTIKVEISTFGQDLGIRFVVNEEDRLKFEELLRPKPVERGIQPHFALEP